MVTDNAAMVGQTTGSAIEADGHEAVNDDDARARAEQTDSDDSGDSDSPALDPGTTPAIDAALNPSVRSVAEALRSGEHPERLSMMAAPKPFDRAAYLADPVRYCAVAEPGRIFQAAKPGDDVPRLRRLGSYSHTIEPGQGVELIVRTAPSMPVTFLSTGLGSFANSLTVITVPADDQGRATAAFTATGGAEASCHILAASPAASGQAKWMVYIDTRAEAPRASPPADLSDEQRRPESTSPDENDQE